MGEIVNLRQARKRKLRAGAVRDAAANRRKHGQSKAEREAARAERAKLILRLDQHRIEADED